MEIDKKPSEAFPPPASALLLERTTIYQIFGSNTNIGKTVFSTLLCKCTSEKMGGSISYLKPIATGHDSDERHVAAFCPQIRSTRTIYHWPDVVYPHLVAKMAEAFPPAPGNDTVLDDIREAALAFDDMYWRDKNRWMFVETAGGVLSPMPIPSISTQADMYSKLRLPVILIGDGKLGGIGATISAYESLRLRGYDVELVLLFKGEDGNDINADYLKGYFESESNGNILVKCIPHPPTHTGLDDEENRLNMSKYYDEMAKSDGIVDAIGHLKRTHLARIERLSAMASKARRMIWWPFTQHSDIDDDQKVTVIDSAKGDYFQTVRPIRWRRTGLLQSTFDGSASWWTQGFGHGNPHYSLAAGYAYGRYGHVIFPRAIHQPALSLAETMLANLGNRRLARVFFSDNGSTGVEVAIKMALRATRERYGWEKNEKLRILGLGGAYHGDTLGAMNCAEPGMFNIEDNWYDSTKGSWLDCPYIACTEGKWRICVPSSIAKIRAPHLSRDREFWDISDLFDIQKRDQLCKMKLLYERCALSCCFPSTLWG